MKVIILILLIYLLFFSNKEFFTDHEKQDDYSQDKDFSIKKMSNLIEVICSQEGKPGGKNNFDYNTKTPAFKNEKECELKKLKQWFCDNYNDKLVNDFNNYGKGLCQYASSYTKDYDDDNYEKLKKNC
jgi:hypothetical protein